MKKGMLLLIGLLFFAGTGLYAQVRVLKKVMELQMPRSADDGANGTRGASVCWNPVTQKYYAAFAGNQNYPLGVFNTAGKLLSDTDQTTLQDIRGLWYNTQNKKICGNTYNDNGWFSYTLNPKGIPTDYTTDFAGMNQPDEQSVGVFDPVAKNVFFLNKGKISIYNGKTALEEATVPIHWGRKKTDGPAENEDVDSENSDYNYTTAVYTGIRNGELGLLNTTLHQVELYSISDGFLYKTLSLPENIVLNPSFNFSFANGIYWFFNIEKRKWEGFK